MEDVSFPARFEISNNGARVEMRPLTNPSFYKSFLRDELSLDGAAWVDLEQELEKHKSPAQVRPAGFIFHCGRTGSVFTANMLNEISGCVVLKEPDVLAQAFFRQRRDERSLIKDLRNIISLIGNILLPYAGQIVIKWSSWTTVHLAAVTKAFPEVPVCFLYRDPVEVLASNLIKPAQWSSPARIANGLRERVPEPAAFEQVSFAFKIPVNEVTKTPLTQFCMETLAEVFATVASTEKEILLVNYTELPEAAMDKIAPYFGLDIDVITRGRMSQHFTTHAHSFGGSRQQFQADSSKKNRVVSSALKMFLDEKVFPHMRAMEAAHNS